uniref:C2 domain-containing protein n=1 Tax=Astatotilapia calliptera TaxID=8154 RepID=A0AAX7V749_ASTCA
MERLELYPLHPKEPVRHRHKQIEHGRSKGSCSSTSTELGFESVSVTGELELALAFNTNTSRLEITVGTCRNLSYGDSKKRKCHPYVKIYVLPDKSCKLKTSVKKNTTDPVYNEVLKYGIQRNMLIGKRLQATVWHSGTLKRKVFLGEVLIPLDGWRFEDKAFQCFNWYPLCPKVKWSTAEKICLLLLKTFACMADMEVVFYKISFLCPSA